MGLVEARRGNKFAWPTVWLLMIAYTISILDRTMLSLMIEPIQRDLRISDTQFGLLQGLAFALCYSISGVPLGALADRMSRGKLLAGGIALWSLMTLASGFGTRFIHLFLARFGVGVGEATLNPAAYSLMADLFPPKALGRATAVFSLGGTLGGGVAFMFGGTLIGVLAAKHSIVVPLLGEMRAWQLAFLITGIPGLFLAAIFAWLPEPQRPPLASSSDLNWSALCAFIRIERKTLSLFVGGFSALNLVNYAVWGWAPAMLLRVRGFTAAEAGLAMGVAVGVFGVVGLLLGGAITDNWLRREIRDAPMRLGALSMGLCLPCILLFTMALNNYVVVLGLCGLVMSLMLPVPGAMAALQVITPPPLRGRMSALYLVVANLVGVGFGPLAVAVFTDRIFHAKSAVNLSIAAIGMICLPLACACFLFARKPFARSMKTASLDRVTSV